MCKELMYKIVYNKKLDWVMKLNWFFIGLSIMVMFILVLNLIPKYIFYMIPIVIFIGMSGLLKQMKETPADLELKFMRNSLCFQLIFFFLIMIILLIVFLGRI